MALVMSSTYIIHIKLCTMTCSDLGGQRSLSLSPLDICDACLRLASWREMIRLDSSRPVGGATETTRSMIT